MNMLVVFIRSIVIYFFLLLVMRLMGKRQIGELQPFEFAITLVIAELACLPMTETAIPLTYGLIPIFTLFMAHLAITQIGVLSIKFRKLTNGKPVIVIDKGMVDAKNLKNLGMNMNDVLEALRLQGYFSIDEVYYAIVETNGKVSILPKSAVRPMNPADMNLYPKEPELPYTIIVEGKLMSENIRLFGSSDKAVNDLLSNHKLAQKDVLIMTATCDTVLLQTVDGKEETIQIRLKERPV